MPSVRRRTFGVPAKAVSSLPLIQRVVATTDAGGNNTWTFPTVFSVAPVVSVDVVGGSSRPFYAQIVSVSATQLVVKVFKSQAITVAVLGVGVEAFTTPGVTQIHLMAVAP